MIYMGNFICELITGMKKKKKGDAFASFPILYSYHYRLWKEDDVTNFVYSHEKYTSSISKEKKNIDFFLVGYL